MADFKRSKPFGNAFHGAFPNRPFLNGCGSVLTMFPGKREIAFESATHKTAEEALSSDWKNVGNSLTLIIRKVEEDGHLIER